jgi:hypothetical protein
MAEAIGRTVLRLTRLSFAGLTLGELRPGQMRPLLPSELNELKQKYFNPSGARQKAEFFSTGAHDQAAVAEKKRKAAVRERRTGQSSRRDPRTPRAGARKRSR